MSIKRLFQIKSKQDARYFAEKIRSEHVNFSYYAPLMGVSGELLTIQRTPEGSLLTVFSTVSGWRTDEGRPIADIVDFIWKDRKSINEELLYPDSDWYVELNSSGQIQ